MQDDAEQRRVYGRQPPTQGAGRGTLRDAIAQEEVLLATLDSLSAHRRVHFGAISPVRCGDQGVRGASASMRRSVSASQECKSFLSLR
jgi:hypothetical protein